MTDTSVLKTERIEIRVTPEEKVQMKLKAKQAGLDVSEFLRLSALRVTIVYRPHEFILSNAINAVGNLVNQVARHCHIHPQNPFTNMVVARLVHIETMLEQILEWAQNVRSC